MRICQIITTLELGGAETLLANFCNILSEKHEITVLYLKGDPKVLKLFNPRIIIKQVPINARCAGVIRDFLKSWKPEIVHTHLGHADFIGLWAARGLPLKMFCTMHNIHFKWDWRDKLIFSIYRFYFQTWARKCQVICISKVVAKHVSQNLNVKADNVHVLYNGIPGSDCHLSKPEAREQSGIGKEKFVILFVGRLEKQKAVHVLLNAIPLLREIPDLQVEIIGSGSLQSELQELTENLGLNNMVNFRGNSYNPEPVFIASDVFVLPSVFEGLGIVILEAFRSRLPVVASAIEGPAELIENNKNGLLFERENQEDLAYKIKELYHNKELRTRLSEEAYERFENNFSIEYYTLRLEQLYKS